MALGSSAPEILLAVVETSWQLGREPEPGKGLGPGTIVGSAAFNLLFIVGICIHVIPDGEVRRIHQLQVFYVTAFFSVFAYLWMLVALTWWTPNEITLAEAFLTFSFFPVLVSIAFVVDTRLNRQRNESPYAVSPEERLVRMGVRPEEAGEVGSFSSTDSAGGGRSGGFVVNKRDLAIMLAEDRARRLREDSAKPEVCRPRDYRLSGRAAGREAVWCALTPSPPFFLAQEMDVILPAKRVLRHRSNAATRERVPYSRYRIQGIRDMTGGKPVLVTEADVVRLAREHLERLDRMHVVESAEDALPTAGADAARFSFSSPTFTCLENCGFVELTVIRMGNMDSEARIRYETSSGTATPGSDYEHTYGTLVFPPGVTERSVRVRIVDDEQWEPDELFFVSIRPEDDVSRLLQDQSRAHGSGGGDNEPSAEAEPAPVSIGPYGMAAVTIIDDDHSGTFGFRRAHHRVEGAKPFVELVVVRSSGSDGEVVVGYTVADERSKADSQAQSRSPTPRVGLDGQSEVRAEMPPSLSSVIRGGDGLLSFRGGEMEGRVRIAMDEVALERLLAHGPVSFRVTLFIPRRCGRPPTERRSVSTRNRAHHRPVRALLDRPDGGEQGAVVGDYESTVVTVASDEEVQRVISQVATAMQSSLDAYAVESESWLEQFRAALTIDLPAEGNPWLAVIMCALTIGWRLLFALVPPTSLLSGYATFWSSLLIIAVLTGNAARPNPAREGGRSYPGGVQRRIPPRVPPSGYRGHHDDARLRARHSGRHLCHHHCGPGHLAPGLFCLQGGSSP